jgi:putative membrane protein
MNFIIIRTIGVLAASYVTKVLAVINHTIRPVFMLISIPVNLLTLGLFSFVINGLMILLADKIVPEFSVPSLLYAIYFAIVLSVINWILHFFE